MVYTLDVLETGAYRDCAPVLAAPIIVRDGVSYFRRYKHVEGVAPAKEVNRHALAALDACAAARGDCISDLNSNNVVVEASGRLVIIDATIEPCFVDEGNDELRPDFTWAIGWESLANMTHLFGHRDEIEPLYV